MRIHSRHSRPLVLFASVMALNETEQIRQAINKASHILITFKKDFSVDAVSSALALYLVLQKINKLVDVISDGFRLPPNLNFLPEAKIIAPKLSQLQKLIINIKNSKENIEQFSYDLEKEDLKIYITPKAGAFSQQDVKVKNSDYKYDLIITLDTPDLDSLGEVYRQSAEFFYNTTIINIDHAIENEHYGQINYTNPNAVATTEIVYQLLTELKENSINQAVATCLLSGIISKTKSFKTDNVTPKTLEIASQLMAAEADRETIIKSLFRNRSLATLRLWGRALARLKNEVNNKLVWTILSENDFVEARADETNLPGVIDELISFIPGVEIAVLIYWLKGKVCVVVQTLNNQHNALQLTRQFKPVGSKHQAEFCLEETTLLEAEKVLIETIQKNLGS